MSPHTTHFSSLAISIPRRSVSGFSLIEVLVSIVVLSFGLLGMVGMQAASLHANQEARLQSTGIAMARELADMIRGNKVEGIKPTSGNPYLVTLSSPLVAPSASYCLNVAGSGCTTTSSVADAQMTEWLARLDAELPGARVVTCYDTAPYDATSGLPTWGCSGTGTVVVIKIGWTRSSTNKFNTGAAALEFATGTTATPPAVVLQVTAGV